MTRLNTSIYLFLAVACVALAAVNASFSMVQTSDTIMDSIPLPKGAERIKDKTLDEKMGHFFNDMAKEFKMPQDNRQAAMLFRWTGDHYKSGRVVFWWASFQKALEVAGYTYRDIDGYDVVTNIWAQEYGLTAWDDDPSPHPIKLASSDSLHFFIAVHNATGRVYIGLWIDQGDSQQSVLALAQVGSKGPVKEVKPPTVSGPNTLLVKNPLNVMEGIAPPKDPTFPPLSAKAGYARGWVRDMAGKPLVGATVSFKSSAFGGLQSTVAAKSNAQGFYEVSLPVGACKLLEADYTVQYNGALYLLPLHVVDGERDSFSSSKGHVENLVLRTWGIADPMGVQQNPKQGDSYYGAPMRVQWFNDEIPEGGIVELTLNPQGALLGPGVPRTFVVRLPSRQSVLSADYFVNNIPIGRYTLTAKFLDGEETMPLRIGVVYDSGKPVETRQIDFKTNSGTYASLERSGIARYDIKLKP